MNRLRRLRWFALALALAAGAGEAQAPYPQRAVRIVVPHVAGSVPDIVARLLAEKLAAALGQPAVVENRPGSATLAAEQVARSAPDGHVLYFTTDAAILIVPLLQPQGQFQVLRDLAPVSPAATDSLILAVNAALPARDLRELAALAAASRPSLAYASSGVGSPSHFIVEQLRHASGMDLLHVPYKGIVAASTATVAGDTALVAGSVPVLNQVKAGTLRALAVSGVRRVPVLPALPTLAESYPGLDTVVWLGLFTPAATPAAVIERLNDEVRQAMHGEDLRRHLESIGGGLLQPYTATPQQFLQVIRRDAQRHAETVRRLGLKPE